MSLLCDTQLSPGLVTIGAVQIIETVLVLSPTDLVAFTGCEHRSFLDRRVAREELERPSRDDPFLEVLRKHGDLHEHRHLDQIAAGGLSIVEVGRPSVAWPGLRAAEAQTLAAMRAGVDVIYQATFFDGRWRGHADFLRRVDTPSELGSWSYEAHDTKLARTTKAATLLQLGEYSRQVARLQGSPAVAPRRARRRHRGGVPVRRHHRLPGHCAATLRGGGGHRAGRHLGRAGRDVLVL